jgi:peptide deformylase
MAVHTVLRMGDPRLLQMAAPVTEFNTVELDTLIQDMFDTMASLDGAGLAAPQIGVGKRLVIFGVEANPRYPDVGPVPTTILINPQLEVLGPELEEGWEGCLSVPGMRGLVPRFARVRYSGFDRNGKHFSREASGFHARVVQHECDHLDGVLYPRRIRDLTQFGFETELFPSQKHE